MDTVLCDVLVVVVVVVVVVGKTHNSIEVLSSPSLPLMRWQPLVVIIWLPNTPGSVLSKPPKHGCKFHIKIVFKGLAVQPSLGYCLCKHRRHSPFL
jgi:hypothetical protein